MPWGTIMNGALIVESRHGGERHLNAVSLHVLYKLLLLSRAQRDGWDRLAAGDFALTTVRPAQVELPVFPQPVAGLELLCMHCVRPWAYAINGRLLVESGHGGEGHINQLEDKTILAVFGTRYSIKEELDARNGVAVKGT